MRRAGSSEGEEGQRERHGWREGAGGGGMAAFTRFARLLKAYKATRVQAAEEVTGGDSINKEAGEGLTCL